MPKLHWCSQLILALHTWHLSLQIKSKLYGTSWESLHSDNGIWIGWYKFNMNHN